MKKLYPLFSLLFITQLALANVTITAVVNGGRWNTASTWNLQRTPANGDTVVIPGRLRVVIDNNINLGTSNLYIKVNGILELNGASLILDNGSVVLVPAGGSIISHNSPSEQILIGEVVKYTGTEGTIIGSAMANNTTGTSPNGFKGSSNGTLPVKFATFNLARQNNNVLIDWSTAQETNSQSFEVQRSENGSNWNTIATVAATGNSSNVQKYTYTDHAVTMQVVYYRIRQVDVDGYSSLSVVRSIKMNEHNMDIKISSGINQNIYVHFSEQLKSSVAVKVTNLNGQVVYQTSLAKPVGQQIIPVQNNLKGIYTVTLTNGHDVKTSSQVLL